MVGQFSPWVLLPLLLMCSQVQFSYQDVHPDHEVIRQRRYMQLEHKWPQATIPYIFKIKGHDQNIRDIQAAMAFYEYYTNIRFVDWNQTVANRLGHQAYIYYVYTGGRGLSLLGLNNRREGQSLDCPIPATCVHEMGHAMGFEHEQYHPERDRWIRINRKNVASSEYTNWKELRYSPNSRNHQFTKTHFDMSSFMLYGHGWTGRIFYEILFPENQVEFRQFYMFKEICDGYGCKESKWCQGTQLECFNDGYVSVVNDQCTCVCLPGLDPATNCKTIIKKGPKQWPSGQFALLEHKEGCPDGNFQKGFWRQYGTGEMEKRGDDFVGDFKDKKSEFSFCTMTSNSGAGKWPTGQYCFLQKGACPNQRGVYEGKIKSFGDFDTSKNVYSGILPEGEYNVLDPSFKYCCVHTGFSYLPAKFPNTKPFILFALEGNNCQEVDGMEVKADKFGLYSNQVTGQWKRDMNGRLTWLNYCVYTPVKRDCGDIINLDEYTTETTIESDQYDSSLTECNWLVQHPNKEGTVVMTFEEFNVESKKDKCDQYVEVQNTLVAQKGARFCDKLARKSVQSLFGQIRVQFRTKSNSQAYFRAKFKWIPDSELCYDSKDGGQFTYRGNVSYTRDFETCLPWAETQQCPHHSYRVGDYHDGLDKNYCRNPDGAFRPWCYTNIEGCKRNFCDVCQLGKPFDKETPDKCNELQESGGCSADSTECAGTCQLDRNLKTVKVSQVHCSRPNALSGSTLVEPVKSSYTVGSKVTYKCSKSGNQIERTCTSTGQWTEALTACLSCPIGFSHYRDNCYKYVDVRTSYARAVEECAKLGAAIALPKTIDDNDFLVSIKQPYNLMWIGMDWDKTSKQFKSNQGNNITYVNWKFYDVPHEGKCVKMRRDNLWQIDSCGWSFAYTCERPITDDKPECKDYLSTCPDLVKGVTDGNCDLKPGLDTFCRYSCDHCSPDCHQDFNFDQSNTKQSISADRRKEKRRYCIWHLNAPNQKGRFVFKFTSFDVKAIGDNCVDSVEVRASKYGPPYDRYCGNRYNSTVVVNGNEMLVRFSTPASSVSHFSADIEWILDESFCYDTDDKGFSYDGPVNYNENFEACMPWKQAFSCENNTLWNSYYLENLKENYCRNMDGSDRPWCYNQQCEKQYCDVCHLYSPKDNSENCDAFKKGGKCSTDQTVAITNCGATCQDQLQATKTVNKVSEVRCSKPDALYGGMLKDVKNSYEVGDRVEYTCRTSWLTISRICLASGTWSPVNTACLDCPYGFILSGTKCYKYFPLPVDMPDAKKHCSKYTALVAAPNTLEENKFISSLRNNERIWLGGSKDKSTFKWNDDTEVNLENWLKAKKQFRSRDHCMVLEKNDMWTDDWCVDKRFSFVCEINAIPYQDRCLDFVDTCREMVDAIPGNDCTAYPSLQSYCRSSCGLCLTECSKGSIKMKSNTVHDLKSNQTPGQEFCAWNFEGDSPHGQFIVTIHNFDVNAPDSLIIATSVTSDDGFRYSGSYEKVSYLESNELAIKFKGRANTKSTFNLSVKWVKDADMCYEKSDKGTSYSGTVSYTKQFKPCTPWAQALNCPHNPIKNGDYEARLDSNYCRNPDGSEQPWCYVGYCQKQYCDVCQLETPVDKATDCDERKRQGQCTKTSWDCARTCDIVSLQDMKTVGSVKCDKPPSIPHGRLRGQIKSQYSVGDKVQYGCSSNSFPIERVCLSNGQWSVANTACIDCPQGYTQFQGNCYKYINKAVDYAQAVKHCKEEEDAGLATPKTQQQNMFLVNFETSEHPVSNEIWLGAQKSVSKNNFLWNDGTPFTYTNWVIRKTFLKRDECVILDRSQRTWDDDWCHDKLFPFFCQTKANENPSCTDFLDNCSDLLQLAGKSTCDPDDPLESLCRKTCGLCNEDCTYNVQISSSKPSHQIGLDRRTSPSNSYCTWKFTAPAKAGRFLLQFDDFSVPSGSSGECEERVEIRDSIYGPPAFPVCESDYEPSYEMLGDKFVVVSRTTASSSSHFTATVTWIADDEMCYNVNDNGTSYNGPVDYSESFRKCLPWAQSLKCPNNPLTEENFVVSLQGNKCRNPDNSQRPWCYVDGCTREFCDVCHLEKPFDASADCSQFKANGGCDRNLEQAMLECAATCKLVPSEHENPVSSVSCSSPSQLPGASIVDESKDSYQVGETITYNCSRSGNMVHSMCLSNGDWSDAKTACLACPVGWVLFQDSCYRKVNDYVSYYEAQQECKKLSAIVAPLKTKEINKFINSRFCSQQDQLWVGAQKSKLTGKFVWSDGEPFTWTSWGKYYKDKALADRDNCILSDTVGDWKDDWCHDKYYNFVCLLESDDKPDCIDFMDSCSDFVQYKGTDKCDSLLTNHCRQSCKAC